MTDYRRCVIYDCESFNERSHGSIEDEGGVLKIRIVLGTNKVLNKNR